MSEGPRQLALALPLPPRFAAEDFLVGPSNEEAYAHVEAWPDWPHHALVLTGPAGAGKSHLAAIWAARARAWSVPRAGLTREDAARLSGAGALVVEDADAPGDEAALFHLLDAARLRGRSLLLTAREDPSTWPLATPDLASRLRAAPVARLTECDDALLRAVLVKLFVDRQLVVDTGVVEEVARLAPRSFAGARSAVEALDARALRERRRVTRALVREVLAGGEGAGEG